MPTKLTVVKGLYQVLYKLIKVTNATQTSNYWPVELIRPADIRSSQPMLKKSYNSVNTALKEFKKSTFRCHSIFT